MINSAILLLLLHYSLLNAQSRSRTHDIKKQTTNFEKEKEKEKEKRETFFPRTKTHHKIKKSLSLSLSPCRWSPSLFLCLSLFLIPFRRNVLKRGNNEKHHRFASFPHIRAFSSASPNRENSCLRVVTLLARETNTKQKNRRIIISSLKSCLPRMMRSAAPTTTTHNQNETHNFHPKRTACKGIRRQRRCRVPLVAMSIPQQGGNAQPRESYISFSLFVSFSFILSTLSIRAIVSRRRFLDAAAMTFSLSSLSTSGGMFG